MAQIQNIKKEPLIAVLMTVHNRCNYTISCLRHLKQNYLEHYSIRVYLVDDGCTDGTANAVKTLYPDVRIICGDGSLYWNRGMLLAWKEAAKDSPDYYVWLNDDTILYDNALQIMFDAYYGSKIKKSIICGSTHAPNSIDHVTYGGRSHKCMIVPNGKLQEAEWLNGNCLLVPACVEEQIGILDPYFRHAKGDWEYSWRARNNGIKLFVAPFYVGSCDANKSVSKCFDSSLPLKERWQFLSHPLGPMPNETLYFCRKCLPLGTLRAFYYILCTYLKTLFPDFFK